MHEIEIALRLVVIGQQLLIAAIFLFGSGNRGARVSGALLLLGAAAYLVISDSVMRHSVPSLLPLVSLLSIALPYFLWLFARSLFEFPLPNAWIAGFLVALGVFVWIVFLFDVGAAGPLFSIAYTTSRVASLLIVGNALWASASGRIDDLLEQRRRFRAIFIVLVSLLVIAVTLVELVVGPDAAAAWLTMLNVIVIGGMTTGLAIPLLRLHEDFFAPGDRAQSMQTAGDRKPLAAADRVLYEKLANAMKSGAYRQTSLTIRSLADELGFPEHQLRRLINRHLGFRNFSSFLNSYRIGEAKERLADPSHARTQVLTIALDLGYGSLGPFNRAFKAMTDMTPTEYRERAIPAASE